MAGGFQPLLRPGMMLGMFGHSTTGAKSSLVLTFSKVQKRDAADSWEDSGHLAPSLLWVSFAVT